MSGLTQESGVVSKKIDEQCATRASGNASEVVSPAIAGLTSVTYDALDYRLMATFPASDAVAQY